MTPTAGQRAAALAAKHDLHGGDFPCRWAAEFEAAIAAAIRDAEAAVRAECVAVVRRLSRLDRLSREELCGGIMAAIESMPLEPPA